MKKQITLNLAALLLGSAILFTSCTKKDLLEMPDEQAAITLPAQSSNATLPILKGVKTWQECVGGSFKATTPSFQAKTIRPFILFAQGKSIQMELYRYDGIYGYHHLYSVRGDQNGATIVHGAEAGQSFLIMVASYKGERCFIPLMQFNESYFLETSKYGTVITVGIFPV